LGGAFGGWEMVKGKWKRYAAAGFQEAKITAKTRNASERFNFVASNYGQFD